MTLVVDASVVLKWMLNDRANESETDTATALMRSVLDGSESILQPVHWLLEVAAVQARVNERYLAAGATVGCVTPLAGWRPRSQS